MTQAALLLFAITAALSPQTGYMMSLKRHPQGATEGYYTFPSKNADKCLTGTKEYLQQVLDKLQSPNSSLRYVWFNSTVQQGYCPDRFMQHDRAGDLCFPDIEVWIDNDPTPILNTNHVRMGSLYKIRHHNFAFPNIKINHPVVMVECLNGTTIGGEAPVATSAVDADAKAVSLLATSKQDELQDPNRPAWEKDEEIPVMQASGPLYGRMMVRLLRDAVKLNPELKKTEMEEQREALPAWEADLEKPFDKKFGKAAYILKDWVRSQHASCADDLKAAIYLQYPETVVPGHALSMMRALGLTDEQQKDDGHGVTPRATLMARR